MGRIYTVSYNGGMQLTGIGVNYDILELKCADDKPVRLRGLLLGSVFAQGASEVAEPELVMPLRLIRSNNYSFGGMGTTPDPVSMSSSDPSAGFSASLDNLSPGAGDIPDTLEGFNWHFASPLLRWLPSEDSYRIKGAQGLVLGTPGDNPLVGLFVVSYTFWVEED